MAATTQQLLDACSDAIAKVLGGAQRYLNPADGSMVEYPALSELRATKAALEAQLATEGEGGGYIEMGVGRGA